MTETKQVSIWSGQTTINIEQDKSKNDEDERTQHDSKRYKGAFAKYCCCCCSIPLLLGFLIGALVAGIALAAVLSIYLVDTSKTTLSSTNIINTTTVTLTTVTTATSTSSTVSTSSTSTSSTLTSSSSTSSVTTTTSTSTKTTSTSALSTVTSATTTTVSSTTSITTTTTTSTTTTAPYCTTRVTFDDIPGQLPTLGVIPNGYNNLNWTNVLYLNASTTSTSGYQTAVNSAPFVAYNPGGYIVGITSANGTKFAFNSVVVAPAWRDNITWTLYGYRNGSPLLAGSFSLYVVNQTRITCGGCSNWDTIYMTATGGAPHGGLAETGPEFAFDDLCISFGY